MALKRTVEGAVWFLRWDCGWNFPLNIWKKWHGARVNVSQVILLEEEARFRIDLSVLAFFIDPDTQCSYSAYVCTHHCLDVLTCVYLHCHGGFIGVSCTLMHNAFSVCLCFSPLTPTWDCKYKQRNGGCYSCFSSKLKDTFHYLLWSPFGFPQAPPWFVLTYFFPIQ